MKSIRDHFNNAKESYDDHCDLQKCAGENLISLISKSVTNTANIMDLGCGTGIITEKLSSAFQYKNFYAIDMADDLLMQAKLKSTKRDINFLHTNFDDMRINKKFNLIFSNMAMHWSENFLRLINSINTMLMQNGTLAFTLPLTGSMQELAPHFAIHNFYNPNLIIKILKENRFELLDYSSEYFTYKFATTLDTLMSLKNSGTNFSFTKPRKGLFTKSFLNQKQIHQLTYVLGYFVARKSS